MSLPAQNDAFGYHLPIRVAVANDYPLVIAGIARALEQHAQWVTVVEYDSQTEVKQDVDVVLFDSFAEAPDSAAMRVGLLGRSSARVLIFTWHTDPELVTASLNAGAAGVVSKTVTPEELVDAVRRVHRGERVSPWTNLSDSQGFGRWPGDEFGISSRESEVLALICQGLSNKLVGESMHLQGNTVKTYIRSLYRKIGVRTRSQAVIWGISNGFQPQTVRVYPQ